VGECVLLPARLVGPTETEFKSWAQKIYLGLTSHTVELSLAIPPGVSENEYCTIARKENGVQRDRTALTLVKTIEGTKCYLSQPCGRHW